MEQRPIEEQHRVDLNCGARHSCCTHCSLCLETSEFLVIAVLFLLLLLLLLPLLLLLLLLLLPLLLLPI
jgi:hypothetical protein